MRYTIEGFSQEYAMTLRKKVIKRNKEIEIKIDCTDLVILRWFVDFYPNMKKMIVDGREYAWLTHNKLKNDLPLIDISTEAFNERMKKLVEFKVLDMGKRLGRFIGEYRNNYFEPDKRNGQIIFSYKPLPNAEEQIYKQISDITISMKSTDYLEMPELIKSNYSVTLDDKEWNKYQELKEDLVLELPGGEITASNAAVLSNKLIQMANGAIYDENGEFVDVHSKKLEALEDLIESANGKPVLVAYWFKHDLERIEKHLKSKKIEFARLDSDKSIKDWNEGKISVALIHPASTGHGLNLQDGGSTIIWFGLTWSLELYEQTNARLWRQGQKAKTVVIEHIVSKGTIDEQIIQALEGKHKVQDSLISAVKVNLSKSESIRG